MIDNIVYKVLKNLRIAITILYRPIEMTQVKFLPRSYKKKKCVATEEWPHKISKGFETYPTKILSNYLTRSWKAFFMDDLACESTQDLDSFILAVHGFFDKILHDSSCKILPSHKILQDCSNKDISYKKDLRIIHMIV